MPTKSDGEDRVLINGSPVERLPDDLYIPPDALEVYLETFEGPLDLLLYLIKKQNLEILEIPVATITAQYMDYIEAMNRLRMELAAEYLVMAAMLAEIKSRMLLPKPENPEENEDDPRAELIRRLQEYERFKRVAEFLDGLPRNERDFFQPTIDMSQLQITRTPPPVDLKELLTAFQDVLRRAEQLSHHHVQRESLSVRERMSKILESLQDSDSLNFFRLFKKEEGKPGAVVSLLAVLELSKEGLVELIQKEPLAEFTVTSAKT